MFEATHRNLVLVILKCFAIVKSSKPLELKLPEQKKNIVPI